MGKYDQAMYGYLDDRERFADFFNGVLFGGRCVIDSEMLEPDSERYVTKSEGTRKAETVIADSRGGTRVSAAETICVPQQKSHFRDLKKRLKNGDWLAITAIENQEGVDYTMPLRMMEYDCLEYQKQIRDLRSSKKKELEASGVTATDINTRLNGEDKLYPVYSICLYHGMDEWQGPSSLKDMMNFEGALPGCEELFHDYGMTLFCADKVEDFSVFKTELRQFLEVIPCRKSKGKLAELFGREEYKHLDRETAEVIAIFTNNTKMLEKLEEDDKEEYDMCQALEELVADGRAEGRAEGESIGFTNGKMETMVNSIRNLMSSMSLTAEQAMNALMVPEEERAEFLAKM